MPCSGGGREARPDETLNSIGVGAGELRKRNSDGLRVASQASKRDVLGRVDASRARSLGLDLKGGGATGGSLDLESNRVVAVAGGLLAREGLVKVRTGLWLERQDTASRADGSHGAIIAGPLAQAVLVGRVLGEVVDLERRTAGGVHHLAGKAGREAN